MQNPCLHNEKEMEEVEASNLKPASIFDPAKIIGRETPDDVWYNLEVYREVFVITAQQKSDYNLEAIAKVLNGKIGELQETVDSEERDNRNIAKDKATKEIFEKIIFEEMLDTSLEYLKAKQEAETLFRSGKYQELEESLFDENGKAKNPQLFKDYSPPAPSAAPTP